MFVRQSCFSDPHVPLRIGPKFRLEMLEKRTTCFQMTSPATSFAAFLTAFQPSWNTPPMHVPQKATPGPTADGQHRSADGPPVDGVIEVHVLGGIVGRGEDPDRGALGPVDDEEDTGGEPDIPLAEGERAEQHVVGNPAADSQAGTEQVLQLGEEAHPRAVGGLACQAIDSVELGDRLVTQDEVHADELGDDLGKTSDEK